MPKDVFNVQTACTCLVGGYNWWFWTDTGRSEAIFEALWSVFHVYADAGRIKEEWEIVVWLGIILECDTVCLVKCYASHTHKLRFNIALVLADKYK